MNPVGVNKDKARQQYLADLQTQIDNNQKYANASLTLRETGQPSAMPDNRTLTEKYEDVMKLKTTLLNLLKTLTDGANASQILEQLSVDQLRFAVNNFENISKVLKPRYGLGVPADVFIIYLNREIAKNNMLLNVPGGAPIVPGGAPIVPGGAPPATEEPRRKKPKAPATLPPDVEIIPEDTQAVEAQPVEQTTPSKAVGYAIIGDKVNSEQDFERLPLEEKKLFLRQTNTSNLVTDADGNKIAISNIKGSSNFSASNGVWWQDTNIPIIVREFLAFKGQFPTEGKSPVYDEQAGTFMQGQGLKCRGKGLALKPSQKFAKKMIPRTEPLEIPYVPFGKHYINRHHLKNNKLVIKTKSGCCIKDIPTQCMSNKLTNIIKTITGNGLVCIEDLNGLSEDEKDNLNVIVNNARINLSVPKTNLFNETEKLVNRFNILKGEFIAGNNNKQAMQELKLLLVRMLNKNLIPRRQATELMVDITSFGY